jgi:DNA helicase-2/ATP-dependent DNA helicase PcrA
MSLVRNEIGSKARARLVMKIIADLHIHSHLSRATSKDLDLEHLHGTAQTKGITVVGTGDFTHPAWLAELAEKLVPAEPGLFRLRDEVARPVNEAVPAACRREVRFLLSVEISSIYKRGGKTRKVHNLVYAPDLEVARSIAERLGKIGNITSDGRPILGLDSRDLLEIVLESSPDAFLIPAHIWTPWFSALGAQSGFDSIAECFADLSDHIFAAETGLSSDPAMNWRLSQLDRLALVSSSDAHSPDKLGREATLFDCELSYFALRDALRHKERGFLGTVEFFPEEGKYHFDGHRKCDVVLTPREAKELGRICPVCKKPLTAGVAGRVEDLADRPEGARHEEARPFQCLVPLGEVLGELCGAGPSSGKVRRFYDRLLGRVGPELSILTSVPAEDLDREGPPLLSEAIARIRSGSVIARPGYDGEYGTVRVFDDDERRRLLSQASFSFITDAEKSAPDTPGKTGPLPEPPRPAAEPHPSFPSPRSGAENELNTAQLAAVEHEGSPLVIVAGPGTGKTKTIVHRIARLVRRRGVSPRAITAITFTKKAAGELHERLCALLGPDGERVQAMTFHALGQKLLTAFGADIDLPPSFGVADEEASLALVRRVLERTSSDLTAKKARERISWAKAHLVEPADADPEIAPLHSAYEAALREAAMVDFDDLVRLSVRLLESSPAARAFAEERARHLFVDEYQDVQLGQYRLVRLLAPPGRAEGLCVVGDPDQAIYGFRGSDPAYFARFGEDYPNATTVVLSDNYRCPSPVVRAATLVIERSPGRPRRPLAARAHGDTQVAFHLAATCSDEADRVAQEIERALGGTSLLTSSGDAPGFALEDIAVLFRTSAQAQAIGRSLERAGIPYFVRGEESMETRFEPEKVALLTLHASKGLEFPLVIVTGCEDGLLPLRLPGLECSDIEEERRLLYVGMTRAKHTLLLTAARRRTLFGRTMENGPCPFLAGLPRDVIVDVSGRAPRKRARQLPLF